MFALDCVVGVGGGPPLHRHLAEDELFYVYEGEIAFTTGGETRTVASGDSVFVARGTAHGYRNEGDAPARMVAVYTPSGMEGWFREVCTTAEDLTTGPPPVTPEMIRRMIEAGPRYSVEWLD